MCDDKENKFITFHHLLCLIVTVRKKKSKQQHIGSLGIFNAYTKVSISAEVTLKKCSTSTLFPDFKSPDSLPPAHFLIYLVNNFMMYLCHLLSFLLSNKSSPVTS